MNRLRPSFVRLSVLAALVLAATTGGGWKWEGVLH